MAAVQIVDRTLVRATVERARQSPRLRTNHNFHQNPDENPHRFLNAWVRGTYGAPHRHVTPPKAESFLVLEGQVALFIFDDVGQVTEKHVLGGDVLGVDIAPGVWHTLAPVSETGVCFEVKAGPYDALTDKEFAAWAPREGDAGAARYLASLMALL